MGTRTPVQACCQAATVQAVAGFDDFLFTCDDALMCQIFFDNKNLMRISMPSLSSSGCFIEQVLLYALR